MKTFGTYIKNFKQLNGETVMTKEVQKEIEALPPELQERVKAFLEAHPNAKVRVESERVNLKDRGITKEQFLAERKSAISARREQVAKTYKEA